MGKNREQKKKTRSEQKPIFPLMWKFGKILNYKFFNA
jgi:hypothetical protein